MPAAGPVQIVTDEPGVVPPGTSLVVRVADSVNTRTAYRGTVYEGNVAGDVVDQNGAVLISRESPLELVVRSFPYLSPGGVGMTGLTLSVEAITVKGIRYPVATVGDTLDAGGIRAHKDAIRTVGADERASRLAAVVFECPAIPCWVFRPKIRYG